jgi:hypothetical protein
MAQKQFTTQHNIGKAKYVINTYNGVDTHKDGSPFWGIEIFKNKTKFNNRIKQLINKGYENN